MSDNPPVSLSRPSPSPAASAKSIPSLNPPSGSTSGSIPNSTPSLGGGSASSSSISSFRAPKSSISRKKPLGLDVSASIAKPSRSAPGQPGNDLDLNGSGLGSAGRSGFSFSLGGGVSEADRLREDIARLQLSSSSRDSQSNLSGSTNPDGASSWETFAAGTSQPSTADSTTPTTQLTSDSSSSATTKKKSSSGIDKEKGKSAKKAVPKDKHGLDLVKDEDLEVLSDIGAGNGGTVTKVWNKKRKCIMARKLILVDAKPSVRKQILRELQIMNDCDSPYIVDYYGCFSVDVHVGLAMEHMDAGSLDYIYRRHGPIPIEIVGKVAEAVLRGLIYLYDVHRIIHRDIKPSNILANTAGEIKICDFGVSGELINSIANTFVGTSTYMSPERIKGAPYTIKSDVWSLGVSLIELALGRFPFSDPPDSASEASTSSAEEEDDHSTTQHDPDATLPLSTQRPKLDRDQDAKAKKEKGKKDKDKENKKKTKGVSLGGGGHTMSILDLLQHIVNEPAPRLVSSRREFPREAVEFVEGCLDKDPGGRTAPKDLLGSAWITDSRVSKEDLKRWAKGVATE